LEAAGNPINRFCPIVSCGWQILEGASTGPADHTISASNAAAIHLRRRVRFAAGNSRFARRGEIHEGRGELQSIGSAARLQRAFAKDMHRQPGVVTFACVETARRKVSEN